MSIPFNAATNAYSNAARLINQAANLETPAAGGGQGGGNDFAKVLADTVQGMVDSGRATDQKSMDLVNGKGNVVDVVTAISQTEIAIETMVSVRDRVISAYEEIMRMPI
jgi:flagellar hook-basal body complex protein FliE